MKSTLEKLEGLSRRLNIEISPDIVNAAFDRVYKAIQKNANIKGFRQGKAPLNTIKSLYRDRVIQDVAQELVSDNYGPAIDQHKLDPVGEPVVHVGELKEGESFHFHAHVEIRPEVALKKYEGLPVEKEKFTFTESELEKVVENLRQSRAELVPVFEDRPAQLGDVVKVDFSGFVDGTPLAGGSAQDHSLEIGSQSFIEGFEEGLIGAKAGQSKELNLKFPAAYHEANLSDKPVTFQVTLKSLHKKSLPDLTDEFATKVGFKSVVDLKEKIRGDIESRENERIRTDLRNRILKILVKSNPIEVPKGLQQKQKERLLEDMKSRMGQQGMSEEQFKEYSDKWNQDFEQSSSFMVQSLFLVDALATQLKLRATDGEVEQRIEEHAKNTGIEAARVREFYKNSERRSNLRFQLTEEKVVEYLLSKAIIQEVPKEKLKDE